jgi:hypothetical protein
LNRRFQFIYSKEFQIGFQVFGQITSPTSTSAWAGKRGRPWV